VKSLSQRAIKKISLELREVFISMSKSLSKSASMTSSMQWSSHHSIYQWIDSSISLHATSESASMTFILNAMIYSLSSFYSSVNLIKHSCATSESATMMSSKSISSMSKLTSESASMTWSSSITSKFMSLFLYQNLNSEFVTMMNNNWSLDWINQQMKQALLCSKSESAVSLLQWHDHNWSLQWASWFFSSESASMTSVNSWSLCWASQFLSI